MANPVLKMTTLDCADAGAEAAFWSTLLGWDVISSGEGYAMIGDGSSLVGFGELEDYEAPGWPNSHGSKQFHFELACENVGETETRALELGATLADPQPGDTWRVLIDPAGHPFCLTDAAGW